jgi:hypothetical protein
MSPAVSWNPVIDDVVVAMVPMSPLTTVMIPELVMPALPPNVPYAAAEPSGMAAGVTQVDAPVVNVHVVFAAIVFAGIARSLMPVAPPASVTE